MHFNTDCQIIRCNLYFEINQYLYSQKSGQWNVHGIWVGPRSKVYLASNKSWKINNLPFNILKLVHTQEWKLQFKVILVIWNTYGVSGKNSAQFLQRYRCIFPAMEKPHFHRHRMYKTLKFLKNISAAKYDPCGYNEWRDPQKPSQILNRLCKKTLSFIIIYHRFQQLGCAKRGRSTGPIFAKTRCPWYGNWTRLIFLKKRKSFAVPQLVFELCLIVLVSE